LKVDEEVVDIVGFGWSRDTRWWCAHVTRDEEVVVHEVDPGASSAVSRHEFEVLDVAHDVRRDLPGTALDGVAGDHEPGLRDEVAEGSLDPAHVSPSTPASDCNDRRQHPMENDLCGEAVVGGQTDQLQ